MYCICTSSASIINTLISKFAQLTQMMSLKYFIFKRGNFFYSIPLINEKFDRKTKRKLHLTLLSLYYFAQFFTHNDPKVAFFYFFLDNYCWVMLFVKHPHVPLIPKFSKVSKVSEAKAFHTSIVFV
jgi:hypothetical protein